MERVIWIGAMAGLVCSMANAGPSAGVVRDSGTLTAPVPTGATIVNPAIDMDGFLRVSAEAARHRATRRISEDEFIRMSGESGTIVLDARSREKFDELHVRGALHLSFPDITIESLARLIPDKTTRILIYCNNNFRDAEGPFPRKLATASLNLSTFVTLYEYGYRNVYELAPLLDARTTRIPLEPTPPATRPR
ncbi:MAG: rhodanese-like domain-containing protein [Candidatus Eisenbacteria bacterium]